MKRILLVLVLLSICSPAFPLERVRGYYKPSTGKYVQSHVRTLPNSTKLDNYSTRGNINPYTGKKGYTNPYKY